LQRSGEFIDGVLNAGAWRWVARVIRPHRPTFVLTAPYALTRSGDEVIEQLDRHRERRASRRK
jgi:hypothetical protein